MWPSVKRTVAAGFIASLGVPACSAADSGFIDIVSNDKPPPPPKPKDTCDVDSQCPPMTPHCDTARTLCVECTGDMHCAAPRPFCNTQTNKCVECNVDQNCPMGQACDPMQHCAP